MTRAVRGAAGIEKDESREIHLAADRLVREIMRLNGMEEEDIISILFSVTRDLTKGNPATGLRSGGFADTPLFCLQEAQVEGDMPRILRVLVTYRTEAGRPPVPVYMGRAAALRPDLFRGAGDEVTR